jgi:hypothetical protein
VIEVRPAKGRWPATVKLTMNVPMDATDEEVARWAINNFHYIKRDLREATTSV